MVELKILRDEKDSVNIQVNSLTIVELLRNYLNKDKDVDFAAWNREHPTKDAVLTVEGKNPKKSIKTAIKNVLKDLDSVEKDFSNLK